jgi:hypothetical protein
LHSKLYINMLNKQVASPLINKSFDKHNLYNILYAYWQIQHILLINRFYNIVVCVVIAKCVRALLCPL